VTLHVWRSEPVPRIRVAPNVVDGAVLIKEERMPDGTLKRIVKDPRTGEVREIALGA
jgi:hypothetical protein